MILTPDGREAHEVDASGPTSEAASLGADAGERVRTKAGTGFFDGWS